MARFVHLADSRLGGAIRRSGLKLSRCSDSVRGVFCVPVVPDYSLTFQWARELRRWGHNSAMAIFFVISDSEPVLLGHYGSPKTEMTAARAHAFFRVAENPLGYEVVVPRRIIPREIKSMAPAPRITGWRFYPSAKGRRPLWPQPGGKNSAKLRRSLDEWDNSNDS